MAVRDSRFVHMECLSTKSLSTAFCVNGEKCRKNMDRAVFDALTDMLEAHETPW